MNDTLRIAAQPYRDWAIRGGGYAWYVNQYCQNPERDGWLKHSHISFPNRLAAEGYIARQIEAGMKVHGAPLVTR